MTENRAGHRIRPEALVLMAGSVVGLSIMGDSLLYAILPLDAVAVGLSLPAVGVLLSANRIVRLLVNTPTGVLFERLGVRLPFILAASLGLAVTLIYGLTPAFLLFLLARVGWGIAWSGLRLGGFHAVWMGPQANHGRLMGFLGAVISLGAALAVLVGGYVRDFYGFSNAVFTIAGVAALAVPLAMVIPWPQALVSSDEEAERAPLRVWLRDLRTMSQWSVLLAAFVQVALTATIVSTAAIFISQRIGAERVALLGVGLGTVTGLLVAVRWMSDLVVGPILGELSDRMGQGRMALSLAILAMIALTGAVMTSGLLSMLYMVVVFLTGAGVTVVLGAAATRIASTSSRPQLFLSAYATAFDAGLALGPILGLTLVGSQHLSGLYLGGGIVAVGAVGLFWWHVRGPNA